MLRFDNVSHTEVAITANFALYSETGKVELFAGVRLSGFAVVAKVDCDSEKEKPQGFAGGTLATCVSIDFLFGLFG